VAAEQADWFFVPRARPQARVRLLCFPHAGSGAFAYRTWPADLPEWVEVCAVQLPGRETRLREKPIGSLPELIQRLLPAIPPQLDRPLALFGHSMGALIAFELARALRRQQLATPVHLLVSGRVAPHLPPRHQPMHLESDDVFIERLRLFNGTADAVLSNVELMRLFLPLLRADFRLNEAYTYAPEPPLDCPISVFGGRDDRVAPVEQMAGWREQTSGRYTERVLPGGHFFVQTAQAQLCRAIAEDLQPTLAALQPWGA
jgi:medium-chain acyl-[acyl-carrier-protein] hydrolase